MYNFETLSPKDFELLTRDLLQKELSITLETFKSGKDGGVDLRHSKDILNQLIVQCKHYKNSTLKDLYNALKFETEKIKKLNPKRYIISTSQSLSPKNKDKIMQICSPFIKSSSDIYGSDDLNNLIKKFPEIEKDHFKLWLTGIKVLEQILHSNIVNESRFKLDEIKEKIKKFVFNPSVIEAQNILNSENFVVISGAPGVGKTTLADMIVYSYVVDGGYEFFNISENIQDAYSVYNLDPNVKQIFYYDDFLGETHLTKNEDSSLITFINRINKSKNKKLILTTREYILQQSKLLHEKIEKFDFKKCIIDLKIYTKKIKADILYSHLYFSELPQEYIDNLLIEHRYFTIIEHPNYNPRIIESMTKLKIHKNISAKDYHCEFIKNLDNPSEIWKHVFENQIDNKTRSLLFSIVSLDGGYWGTDCKQLIKEISKNVCAKLYSENFTDLDFRKCLKILEGDFIKVNQNFISFCNPSLTDFLENYIVENNIVSAFIEIADTLDQFIWIEAFLINKENINKKYAYVLFEKVKQYNSNNWQYRLVDLLFDIIIKTQDMTLLDKLQSELSYVVKDHKLSEMENFLNKLTSLIFDENEIIKDFITDFMDSVIKDVSSFNSVYDLDILMNFLEDYDEDLIEQYGSSIKVNIIVNLDDLIENSIDNCDCDPYILECDKEKLENFIGKFNITGCNLRKLENTIEELRAQQELDEANENENSKDRLDYLKQMQDDNENIKDLFLTLKNNLITS